MTGHPPAKKGRETASGAAIAELFDFAAVVDRFQTPLLRYAGHLLSQDPAQAEDVVQEAFLRLYRQVRDKGRDSIRSLSTWLFRVAHNLARDQHRRQRRRHKALSRAVDRAGEQAAGVDDADRLSELIRREVGQQALAEVRALPEDQRSVLLLRVIQDMSYREIGEVTGMTVGNVAYHLDRGLKEVARRLKEAQLI